MINFLRSEDGKIERCRKKKRVDKSNMFVSRVRRCASARWTYYSRNRKGWKKTRRQTKERKGWKNRSRKRKTVEEESCTQPMEQEKEQVQENKEEKMRRINLSFQRFISSNLWTKAGVLVAKSVADIRRLGRYFSFLFAVFLALLQLFGFFCSPSSSFLNLSRMLSTCRLLHTAQNGRILPFSPQKLGKYFCGPWIFLFFTSNHFSSFLSDFEYTTRLPNSTNVLLEEIGPKLEQTAECEIIFFLTCRMLVWQLT